MKWFFEFLSNNALLVIILILVLSGIGTFFYKCWLEYWKYKTIRKMGYPPSTPIYTQPISSDDEEEEENDYNDWDEEEWKSAYIKKQEQIFVLMNRISELEKERLLHIPSDYRNKETKSFDLNIDTTKL